MLDHVAVQHYIRPPVQLWKFTETALIDSIFKQATQMIGEELRHLNRRGLQTHLARREQVLAATGPDFDNVLYRSPCPIDNRLQRPCPTFEMAVLRSSYRQEVLAGCFSVQLGGVEREMNLVGEAAR